VIKALDCKLLRYLARLKTQAVTIALVVASAVAIFLATVTTYRSLRLLEQRYYEDRRVAHVWAWLAPWPNGHGVFLCIPALVAVHP